MAAAVSQLRGVVGRDMPQLFTQLLVGLPQIVALLHSQPEPRSVAAELPEPDRHLRCDAVGPLQDAVLVPAGVGWSGSLG